VFWCHNHCKQATVRAALLADRVPAQCLPRIRSKPDAGQQRQPPSRLDPARESAIRDLMLDPAITPTALRIGVLQLLDGLSALDVQKKLGISRSTYYDAVRILGQHRRSEGVQKSGLPTPP
jgi:hypothetical protein